MVEKAEIHEGETVISKGAMRNQNSPFGPDGP